MGDELTGLTIEIKQASSTRFGVVTDDHGEFAIQRPHFPYFGKPGTKHFPDSVQLVGNRPNDPSEPEQGRSERWLFIQFRIPMELRAFRKAHNDDYPYRIPYSISESFGVGQEYFGTFSHHNSYAIDWDLPEGTNVLAAREGVVIDLKEDSNEAGTEEEAPAYGKLRDHRP